MKGSGIIKFVSISSIHMNGTGTIILFTVLSIPVVIVSWKSLLTIRSHGFYRFLSWECILWLGVSNYRSWFTDAFRMNQIVSWILLVLSLYVVLAGVFLLRSRGNTKQDREDSTLLTFEKTTELVDTGIYRYIRHPLYASLFYLTWGICLKHITLSLVVVSLFSSLFIYITARFDEKECIAYFGDKYRNYMMRSKMFIPFLF